MGQDRGAFSKGRDKSVLMLNQAQDLQGKDIQHEDTVEHQGKTHPAVRTMKSDMEAMLRGREVAGPEKITITKEGGTTSDTKPTAPRSEKKNIFLVALGVMILFMVAAFGYRFLLVKQPDDMKKPLIPPPPFFAIESSQTITIKVNTQESLKPVELLVDAAREKERVGAIKRLILVLQEATQERFIELNDLFNLLSIETPTFFFNPIASPLMTFIYYGSDGPRFGLLVKTSDVERAFSNMLGWDNESPTRLKPLLLNEVTESKDQNFEDRTYRNIGWRFLKLSPGLDLGIGYTVFPAGRYLLITTSKESMEKIIDRLFDAL